MHEKGNKGSTFQQTISKQLDKIVTSLAPEVLKAALSTLKKIFDNIIQHPNDDKYRRINKTPSSKMWRYPVCEELMKMSGWVVEDDHVRLRDDSHVHIVSQLLELSCGREYVQVFSSGNRKTKYAVSEYESLVECLQYSNISDVQRSLKPCNISTAGMIYCENGSSVNLLLPVIISQKLDIVELLVRKYSVDPYAADDNGTQHVFLAFSISSQSFIINLLKICGVNMSCKLPKSGFTILHHAVKTSCFKVVRFLVEKCQVDLNLCDNCFGTPLHIAYMYGQSKLVQYLIRYGADEMAVDSGGKIPHHYIEGVPELIAMSEAIKNCRIVHRIPGSAEYMYYSKLCNTGTASEEAVTRTMEKFPSLKAQVH